MDEVNQQVNEPWNLDRVLMSLQQQQACPTESVNETMEDTNMLEDNYLLMHQ